MSLMLDDFIPLLDTSQAKQDRVNTHTRMVKENDSNTISQLYQWNVSQFRLHPLSANEPYFLMSIFLQVLKLPADETEDALEELFNNDNNMITEAALNGDPEVACRLLNQVLSLIESQNAIMKDSKLR